MAERKVLKWITVRGHHVPIYEDEVNIKEPEAHVEPFTRMATHLKNKGIETEEDIVKYLAGLSSTRRSKLAREMGIESRGHDKIKEMAHRIYEAGHKDVTPAPEPPKKEEEKKDIISQPAPKPEEKSEQKSVYPDILGPKMRVDSLEAIERCRKENLINPHSSDWDDSKSFTENTKMQRLYHTNCALCTCAIALQARGYDVEAMPRDKDEWRGAPTIFDFDYFNADNFIISANKTGHFRVTDKVLSKLSYDYNGPTGDYKNIAKMPKGAKAAAKAITDRVKSWGSGAIGELNVQWKDTSSSHSVSIINQHGTVVIYDGQSNSIKSNIEAYLERTVANATELVRLDNAPLKADMEKALEKMVKQRKKW